LDDIRLFTFVRDVRTEASEIFTVLEEDEELGRLDVHYGPDTAYASLFLFRVVGEERIRDLIAAIDKQIVSSVLPPYDRLDFLTTVFHGQSIGTYGDPRPEEELGTENGN
jgi:hypothetical protein